MFDTALIPLIKSLGYGGIFTTILLENGIPLLFFLPGDTLLATAGFLSAQGFLNLHMIMVGCFIVSVLGYMLGYHLGRKMQPKLFKEGSTNWFRPENLEKTKNFYEKYGNISIFLARFLPLRACVSFMAGVANMHYSTFMFYNILSALIWAVGLPLMGSYLGKLIPIEDMTLILLIPLVLIIGGISLFSFIFRRYLQPRK